ncbi:MAG: restriction endonuclease subunit S [Saprospiraceae bacterium]|nr:restriction endonuclease subunit S [Saprospiraceae bacterium]
MEFKEFVSLNKLLENRKSITYGIVQPGNYHENGIVMIRSQDYSAGWGNLFNLFKVSEEIDRAYIRSRVSKGDILITVVGANIGKIAVVPVELDCSNISRSVARISIDSTKANSEFIRYFLENRIERLLYVNKVGGAQPVLNLDDLQQFKIPLPPLSEQKAIAQVLSSADAAIHTTEKLIAQKELRKKWLMQQLLTGKKRMPAFANAAAGKKRYWGEWKELHLGDMFTERNETKFFDLPLLSIGQNGVYPQDESVKKDTSNEDKSKYKRICPGDIGYNTMRMWQGRSALSELEGIVSPAYTVVIPKKNADSIFFSYLFKMPKMTNLFWRNSQGLVDDTLNCKFKDFSIVKVMLPQTKEEQTAIAQVLQAVDKEIILLKAKAEKLREQKKGLMQVLLTGKKRLSI